MKKLLYNILISLISSILFIGLGILIGKALLILFASKYAFCFIGVPVIVTSFIVFGWYIADECGFIKK